MTELDLLLVRRTGERIPNPSRSGRRNVLDVGAERPCHPHHTGGALCLLVGTERILVSCSAYFRTPQAVVTDTAACCVARRACGPRAPLAKYLGALLVDRVARAYPLRVWASPLTGIGAPLAIQSLRSRFPAVCVSGLTGAIKDGMILYRTLRRGCSQGLPPRGRRPAAVLVPFLDSS